LSTDRDLLLTSAASDVKHIAFSPDGAMLSAACADGVLREWDFATGEVRQLQGHTKEIEYVLYESSGDAMITASLDGTIRRWQDTIPAAPDELQTLLRLWTNATIGANNEVVFE
jgi:WD40 repeat protein